MILNLQDLIETFVEKLDFDLLIGWADMLKVPHNEDEWFDDDYVDREDTLRVAIAEAMMQVGRKKDPYRHYNKARAVQLSINQFNKQNKDGYYD